MFQNDPQRWRDRADEMRSLASETNDRECRTITSCDPLCRAAQSFIDFPPMQQAASFNLSQGKEKVEQMMKSHEGR